MDPASRGPGGLPAVPRRTPVALLIRPPRRSAPAPGTLLLPLAEVRHESPDPLVESRLLRAWAAVAYAFLPAATGALASGHIGTAVLAVLLPL
ncbi:hypothetical protein, partial [Streptomyces sp. McG8]|uniref:hypothetical protein n=1 Tax=Streptomyces sp. McG8 TaxID=2725487 RepID=UPI0020375F3C